MRHTSLLAALLTLAIVPGVAAAQSTSQSVWGPFGPAARYALAVHLPAPTVAAPVCGDPPAPVVHLAMNGFYADPSSNIVDPGKMAAYQDAVKPVEAFETGIAHASDRFVRTGDQDGARCALAWMTRWADAGAMLDAPTSQGGYARKWASQPSPPGPSRFAPPTSIRRLSVGARPCPRLDRPVGHCGPRRI